MSSRGEAAWKQRPRLLLACRCPSFPACASRVAVSPLFLFPPWETTTSPVSCERGSEDARMTRCGCLQAFRDGGQRCRRVGAPKHPPPLSPSWAKARRVGEAEAALLFSRPPLPGSPPLPRHGLVSRDHGRHCRALWTVAAAADWRRALWLWWYLYINLSC